MTDRHLLKKLQYQQSKIINIQGYSFHLIYFNNSEIESFFSISIHDNSHSIIYSNIISKSDSDLREKLIKLKTFIDDLFNN